MVLVYLDLFLVIISFLIAGTSFRLIYLWIRSIKYSPRLTEKNVKVLHSAPKVSIIVPIRNEEKSIGNCIDSLLNQDYPNFELILVNDKSTDRTPDILKQYSEREQKVRVVNLEYKPDNWIGKSWACLQGYLHSDGEILLFTDADTYHMKNTLRLAVQYLIGIKLDALSMLPKMLAANFFVKVTLPFLTLYQHTYISPININDPSKKAVNYLAHFCMIKKTVYDQIGTHETVRDKFSEDLAIGEILKKGNFRMHMVRGELNLTTDTIRTPKLIFNQISRYIIPYFRENKLGAIVKTLSEFAITFLPFLLLAYSILSTGLKLTFSLESILFLCNLVTVLNIIIISSLQSKYVVYQNPWYGIAAPVGACIFSFAFIIGLVKAIIKAPIGWREREYDSTFK